jgi:hypothetical protein
MNEFAHKKITEISLKKTGVFEIFGDEYAQKIIEGSVLPDIDENQSGFVHHFYNPVTEENYKGTEDSAKSRCICHFGKYVESGNCEELGRSIHFLEDICTPVHVQYEDNFDSLHKLPTHIQFEKEFDEFLKQINYSKIEFKISKISNLTDLIHVNSLVSSLVYKEYASDKKKSNEVYKFTLSTVFLAVNSQLGLIKDVHKAVVSDDFIAICYDEPDCSKFFDVATRKDNIRVRNTPGGIYVYEKSGYGRNFKLKEVVETKNIF